MYDDHVPPASPVLGDLPCQGERHKILFQDGVLQLLDHQDERLEAFRVLAGQPSTCERVRESWQQMCLPVTSTGGADFFAAMLLHERDPDEQRLLRNYAAQTGPEMASILAYNLREGGDEHVQHLRRIREDASRRLELLSMSESLRVAFCLTAGLLTIAGEAPWPRGGPAGRARYALFDALEAVRSVSSLPDPIDDGVLADLGDRMRRYIWSQR